MSPFSIAFFWSTSEKMTVHADLQASAPSFLSCMTTTCLIASVYEIDPGNASADPKDIPVLDLSSFLRIAWCSKIKAVASESVF